MRPCYGSCERKASSSKGTEAAGEEEKFEYNTETKPDRAGRRERDCATNGMATNPSIGIRKETPGTEGSNASNVTEGGTKRKMNMIRPQELYEKDTTRETEEKRRKTWKAEVGTDTGNAGVKDGEQTKNKDAG